MKKCDLSLIFRISSYLFFILIVCTLLLLIVSCQPAEHTADTDTIDVAFSVKQGAAQEPNEIVYANVYEDFMPLKSQILADGTNIVSVPKNGTYVIGLVNKSEGSRNISSAISTIGNVSVVSVGLDTLPVGDDSLPVIDLGDLTPASGSYLSDNSSTEIASQTGNDEITLVGYGASDQLALKALNPDINRNGIYDSDEGIGWIFICAYWFFFDITTENFDSGTVPYQLSEIPYNCEFQFQHNGEIPSHEGEFIYEGTNLNSEIRLYLPEDTIITTNSGDEIDYLSAYNSGAMGFSFAEHPEGMNPRPPYEGDYSLYVYGDRYYLENVEFLKPSEDFENLLILIYKQEYDSSGNVTRFHWKWKKVLDGSYVDADPEEVKLRITKLDISWGYAGGSFNPDYDPANEQLYNIVPEEYWYNGSIVPPEPGVNAYNRQLGCTAFDAAGNAYVYMQPN